MANPSATVYSASGDGYIRNHGNFSWSAIRDGSSGTKSADSTASAAVNFAYNDGTTADKYIDRGFFAFDLSSIPAGSVIQSVTLGIWVTAKDSGAGGSLGLTSATQASTSTLSTSDFTAVGSSEYITRVNFSSLTTGGYNTFSFNSTGLTAVQSAVGGYFKCSTRGSFDIDNSAPGTTVWSGAYGYYSERTGTSNDPYLLVTYSNARTTSDSWAWGPDVATGDRTPSGGHLIAARTTSDAWAWSDRAHPYNRNSTPILLRAEGANTYLNGTQAGNSATITVASTTGFASSGQFGIVDYTSSTYYQEIITYTGKTGTTFTGCTGGTSYSFPGTTSLVGALDAHNNFPQITPLETTYYPVLLCTYKQGCWHGDTEASIKGKISYDGGANWSAESTIMECVQSGRGMGLHNIKRLSDGTYFMVWQEWGHDYSAANALACYTARGTLNTSTFTITWDTPVRIPTQYSKDDMACGTSVVEYGGNVYVPVYGLDSGGRWDDVPQVQYSKLLKTTDKGATTGNWSVVGTMATLAQTNTRGNSEPSLIILDNGTWLAHFRVETNTGLGYTTLDRYQATSTDAGVTWSGHTRIIQGLGNSAVTHLMPETHIVTQGQDLVHGGQTITYISTDQGTTWPSTYYRQEATDATYSVGNGSDFATILRAPTDPISYRQVVNAYAQERATQGGSQTKFQWYSVANFPITADVWAWSDTATRTLGRNKSTSDSWAWSDTATKTQSFSRVTRANFGAGIDSETWLWSDTAAQSTVSSISRTTSDAWAWSETATRTVAYPRPSTDTLAWSDLAVVTSTGPSFYSRTTSDTWAWADAVTSSAAIAYFWLRRQRSSMSAPTKTYVQVQPKGTARTSTWTSPTYKAETEAGILVVLDVTSASGTGGLTLRINAHDQASSQAVPLNAAPSAVTATGTTSYALYPFGAVAGSVTQATSFYLPRMFSISVTHGDSSSYTYSVGFCLLP